MDSTSPAHELLLERFDSGDYVHHQPGEREFFYEQFGVPSQLRRDHSLAEPNESQAHTLAKIPPTRSAAAIIARRAGGRP